MESLTRPVTHIVRLLKWGRILARHGALRGIETAPQTPPGVKRLCRIARLGTIQPKVPDYAAAFQAIGPAAVKLGQTLATRPDLVGEEAARNLLTLQDAARQANANAVTNIASYYKKNEFKSTTNFECYAGAILAGVALKGTYAKVK